MTRVIVFQESAGARGMTYRAVAGQAQSMGNTVGEAVDALAARLSPEESGTLIIVRDLRPDALFDNASRHRLTELMSRWRAARDAGVSLPPDEQAELERLTDDEIRAAGARAGS